MTSTKELGHPCTPLGHRPSITRAAAQYDLRQREISSRPALQWTAAAQQNGEVSVRSRLSLEARIFHQRNWPVPDVSADLISALAKGTNLDIAATDQIRPIATTTVIPIPVRICNPLCVALSLAISAHIFLRLL